MLTNLKILSPVLVMISSTSVPICNRFHATRAISSKITTFRGYPSLTPGCAGLLELTGLGLGLLKFTFNAEKFIRRLSWSISSRFVTVHCWNVRCSQKLRKITLYKHFFGGGIQGYRCWQIKKCVTNCACYNMQHVCTYLQPFSHHTSQ